MYLFRICYPLAACFLLLSWLFPSHYQPWPAFYNDYLALVALALLLLADCRTEKKVSPFLLLLLLALASVGLQFSAGIYHFGIDVTMAVVWLVSAFAGYQVGLSTGDARRFVRELALVAAVGGCATAILGISQWTGYTSAWIYNVGDGRSAGNLAQANNYATLIFWGVCGLSYLFLAKQISRFLFFFIGAVLAFGIIVSESRTPVLQAAFFVVWAFVGYRRGLSTRRAVLVPIAAFGCFYTLFPFIDAFVHMGELQGVRLVDGPYSNRVALWLSAVAAITESGWLGYGWGQVSVAQFTHLGTFVDRVALIEHSHNIMLDLLIWAGPGFGLLIIGFSCFWIGRQFWRVDSLESWFLMACVGAMLIHANLEFPLEYAYFLLPFFLMLGLVDNEQGRGRVIRVNPYVFSSVLLVPAIAMMAVIWQEYRVLEEDHRVMRAQNFGLPVDPDLRLSKDVKLIDGERDYIRFARTPATEGLSDEELAWMKKVTYRYPFAVLIYRYSNALALNGRTEQANEELEKIRILFGADKYNYYKWHFDRVQQESLAQPRAASKDQPPSDVSSKPQ